MRIDGKKLNAILPNGTFIDDYACIGLINNDINSSFAGERYLMYRMLRGYINGVKIPDAMYITCMKKIQQAMQRKVARYGICIETNPSSNFKISTLDTYEEHPITKFYNMGLTWNEELLDKCPQIHASINTDDKGLFDTSLENEYALIGRSLEKKYYNKQYVYEWLDRIRENGSQQSFKTRCKDDT